jgi:hypothetical protein
MEEEKSMTESDAAWSAGFFDGEGSIGLYHYPRFRDSWAFRVNVSQKSREPLDKLMDLFGGSILLTKARPNNRKPNPIWQWSLTNVLAIESFLQAILPYSVLKRVQIAAALEFCELRRSRVYRLTDEELIARTNILMRIKKAKNV